MRTFVYPYKPGSQSAKLLAASLGAKLIKHTNSKYQPKATDVIINWGSASIPDFPVAKILNKKPIGNKLEFFKKITAAGLSDHIPPWTESSQEALAWVDSGKTVVARTLLNSHSGKGIYIFDENSDALDVDAPLWTQYIKKAHEYRVYWVKGSSGVLTKQKLKKNGQEHSKIQNLDNGYVYGNPTEEISPVVAHTAYKVAEASGMDFGGIDVIWNRKQDKAYVLEINSAIGMVESTCEFFSAQIKSVIA